jgi:hypothetical protein
VTGDQPTGRRPAAPGKAARHLTRRCRARRGSRCGRRWTAMAAGAGSRAPGPLTGAPVTSSARSARTCSPRRGRAGRSCPSRSSSPASGGADRDRPARRMHRRCLAGAVPGPVRSNTLTAGLNGRHEINARPPVWGSHCERPAANTSTLGLLKSGGTGLAATPGRLSRERFKHGDTVFELRLVAPC